jgi:hypothetical protein
MPSQGNYRTQQHTCVSTSLKPRSPHTVNGSFAAPNGLVCELPPEAAEAGVFATFTDSTGKVRCNLGEDLRLPTDGNVNLRDNLVAIYRAIALQLRSKSAEQLLGHGDAAKLRSSASLFAVVSDPRVADDSELHGLCWEILSVMGTYGD